MPTFAATEENYTAAELEEKNIEFDKFLHVYKQYKSYQELLSKLEEAVDSDERDYYMRCAHHLLQCEENGMRLGELPMYESKKKGYQLSDNPWETSDSEMKMKSDGMDSDSMAEANSSIPLEKLKEVLFRPGMKLKGHIVVPGLGDDSPNYDEEGNEMSDSNEDEEIVSIQRNRGGRSDNSNSMPNERGRASSNTDESNEGEESRKSYELVIMERGDDPLGNYQICASHAAYGDEQCVRIQLSIEEVEGSDTKRKRLRVEYSDGETSCSGYWNEEKFRLEGNVRQRLQANDGIFHTSEVTHVFTLYPCTGCFPAGRDEGETTIASAATKKLTNQDNNSSIPSLEVDLLSRDTAAIAAHRKRTEDVMKVCMSGFVSIFVIPPPLERPDMMKLRMFLSLLEHRPGELSSIESQLNEKQKLYWKLRNVDFSELLTQVHIVQGEHTCALFRSRAALLDSFHFNTIQDQDKFIAEWKEKKMDLQKAHKQWDVVNFLMKYTAQMVATFEPGGLNPKHQSLIFTSMHRLHVSYECLESSYRRAEKRLTKEELTKYEINTDQQHQEGLKNVDCIICQMPLLDEGGEVDMSCLYKLPCSHCFHKKCVEQWLHNNSTCPACRLDLTNDN